MKGGKDKAEISRQRHHVLGSADLTLIGQVLSGNTNSRLKTITCQATYKD